MSGKEHAKTLGILFWVYEGFQIFSLILGFLILLAMSGFMFSQFSKMPHRADQPPPEVIFGIMGVVFIVVIVLNLLFLIPGVVAAYGLKKEKSWAKTWLTIACVLAALNFPLGTGLAIYGLWFVFGNQGKAYFENRSGDLFSAPPPPNNWR